MNENRRNAIDRYIKELRTALPMELFLSHLVVNGIFTTAEKKSVKKEDTDEETMLAAFRLLKDKERGWESLIEYLTAHKYGGQWVVELKRSGDTAVSHQAGLPAANNGLNNTEGSFNITRKSAMNSLMPDLKEALSGAVETFVTHLQLRSVITQKEWQPILNQYHSDDTRIFHLLNDVLVGVDGSWEEILVFLYTSNRANLARKLQSAAGEPEVNPRSFR